MSTLLQDLKYGLRMLAKSPGFTAVVAITLALGIGANTVLFSVVNGVLLNPLPYPQPDRLVALYSRTPDSPWWSISYPNFLDWVRENRSFSALAGYRADSFNLTGTSEPERVTAEMISASFFSILGVKPVIGRNFLPEEDQVGAARVALISGGLWKRKFGSSLGVMGKSIVLNGDDYTVIGVIPEDFNYTGNNFDRSKDVYVPIGQWNEPAFRDRKVAMGMDAVGRLKPGVTFEQAKADTDALGRHLAEEYPDANKGTGISLLPLKQNIIGDIKPTLVVLLAAVGFVLLIACVNVANLLLARSTARHHEFAIRAALGARRGRVVRQLLTESILLALGGGALGLLLASWGTRAALNILPAALPRAEEVRLDGHVLLFTLVASTLAGILFGLVPALKTFRGGLQETLKEGGRGSIGAHHRVQGVLVTVEMALAVILLAGAGLMLRSLAKLWSVDPGFNPHQLLTFSVSLPPSTKPAPDAIRVTWRQMHDQLSAVPGVKSASLTVGAVPMRGDSEVPFWLEGQPKPPSQNEMKQTTFYTVQPDYIRAMGIPLLRGRFLSLADNEHSPLVVVIDERFRQLYFGNQDPIGKRVNFDILNVTAEIVGVVGHVKQWGLEGDSASSIQAQSYFQLAQVPDRFLPMLSNFTRVVVRTAGSPLAQVGSIRHTLTQINSQELMYGVEPMDEIISDSLAPQQFAMVLLGIFAVLAVGLSCVGIYGVVSYFAGQRTHEIGVRMALGAGQWHVLQMVLSAGAKMALAGVAVGLAAALGLVRLMANQLFGISSYDPLTFAGVAGLLILVALAACYIPARRATKVDPMEALRYE